MLALWMFPCLVVALFSGFPVAFGLAGVGLLFALLGTWYGYFELHQIVNLVPKRIYDNTVESEILIAVPLFILMGMVLERSRIAEDLLAAMQRLFGRAPGGLALAVVLVGALMAASTGIVGATVVTMTVMSLPIMLQRQYDPGLASGTIAASGTLGQIIPPSIVLILLGDQLGVSVGKLFQGAMLPGLILVAAYAGYILLRCHLQPRLAPPMHEAESETPLLPQLLGSLVPALALIVVVLGSILIGWATPTEASGCGAVGAVLLALSKRRLSWVDLRAALHQTVTITAMVLFILACSQFFSLVFQFLHGDQQIVRLFTGTGMSQVEFVWLMMLLVFVLGFFLDFLEICFIVVPVLLHAMHGFGLTEVHHKVLIGVLLALNLQTSFLTPPFGFALFYLKGAAPAGLRTGALYRGIIPFVIIQLLVILLVWFVPDLVMWLPMAE